MNVDSVGLFPQYSKSQKVNFTGYADIWSKVAVDTAKQQAEKMKVLIPRDQLSRFEKI